MSKKLTLKQRLFVESYLSNGFNGVRAAEAAGYQGEYHTLSQVAYENLRKPEIVAVVENRLKAQAMSSDEILARLAAHARADLSAVLQDDGTFDFCEAVKRGTIGLVREWESKTNPVTGEVTTKIRLHDAQTALVQLGRAAGLFKDKAEHSFDLSGLSDEELDELSRISTKLHPA